MTVMVLCCILFMGMTLPVSADMALPMTSEAVVLMDAETGQILYEKNMHDRMYPASITKVMTAIEALEYLEPDRVLTATESALRAVPYSSSHIYLVPGEEITVEQAMYALGMESANDAANVLAEAVSGNLEAFAQRMTSEAKALGALNTNFTNANGLPDENHYTTAYDMAVITRAALQIPGFTDYFSTVDYECPATNKHADPRSFHNKDQLLPGGPYYYEGVQMAKTGWTSSAQGTFVTAVKRGDTTLIAVLLKSVLTEFKYKDAWILLNYGFDQFRRVTVTGEELAEKLSLRGYNAVPGQEYSVLIPADSTVSQLAVSLAENAVAEALDGKTATAVVTANIGDMDLPEMELQLQWISPEQETVSDEEQSAAASEKTGRESKTSWLTWIVMGAAMMVVASILISRENEKKRRRRENRRVIENMKKRMEE